MTKKLNTKLIKIVHILSDGGYHDGNSIGERLGMTRSAVWKIIKKLENYAINIASIKGKGYALLEPLILLEPSKIKKNIQQDKIDLMIFESISSTNDFLRLSKGSKQVKICLAEQQEKGKGRLHREWYSPFGKNIYLSCLFPFQKDISELAGLSLVVSLAIMKTLKNLGIGEQLFAKWPNDIFFENKKISGCLIEVQAETHGYSHAVIGVGINVNMLDEEQHISQAWTSMQKILGAYVDRNIVCATLINNLLRYLQQFEARGFQYFIDEWMHADCLTNQDITLKNMEQKIKGKVVGVNEQGLLLLKLADNSVRAFSAGDTSVVKKKA